MNKKSWTFFLIILLISICANFLYLNLRYEVGWDQVRDAEIVYDQIIRQKDVVLLGPRVVGPQGFFLGPLHYYLLIPFYFLMSGDLFAGAIAAGTVGVLTTIGTYFITKKIFDEKAAIIVGLLYAIIPTTISWNVMYLPLLTYMTYYFCLQILKKRYKLLPYAGLIIGLGLHIHFTVIFLALFILCALMLSQPKRKDFKEILKGGLLSLGVIMLFLLPLILFDLKHQGMNIKLLSSFFSSSNNSFYFNLGESIRVFLNSFDFFNRFETLNSKAYFAIAVVIIAVLSSIIFDRKHAKLALFWIFAPLFLFSFYQKLISEYYFNVSIYLVILYAGLFFSRFTKYFIPVFICFLLVALIQLKTITTFHSPYSLHYQKQLINYLDAQTQDQKFNISFELYFNWDVPFRYLAKRSSKYSAESDGHLYTVVMHNKYPESTKFGGFGLVRK